ncbi:MAG: 6-phosphogluconolactonase [Acidimicrobiia bacterium]
MTFRGEIRQVESVPQAFAELVAAQEPSSIALSGGSTAEEAYRALAALGMDWSATDVYLGDERFVPVTDPDSNEGMIRAALFSAAEPHAIHSMAGAGATVEAAADAYDALVAAGEPIDLVHLGLGPDGHTASLFPGATTLEITDRFVVSAGDELHPHPRLTFTYPAIARSPLVVFTITGAEKRDAFARVRAGDDAMPAARVRADQIVWLVDAAALG